MNDYGLYLNVATLLALIGGIVKITLHVSGGKADLDKSISQTEAEIRKEANDMERQLIDMIEKKERESIARAENLRQATGEMGTAIRAKIHDMECWNRDNFVTNKSFEAQVDRLEKSIDKVGDKLEEMPAKFAQLAKQIIAKT